MNLVIDDAVEVQLATEKTSEQRRQLGKLAGEPRFVEGLLTATQDKSS